MSDYLMCAALICVQVHLFKIPSMKRSKIVDAHTVDANVVKVSDYLPYSVKYMHRTLCR